MALAGPALLNREWPTRRLPLPRVVITGSRIVRDGFKPTPVTTLTGDALQSKAPSNIPDARRPTPAVPRLHEPGAGNTFSPVSPNQGSFYLNLRNLGTQRSLILLDGLRVPPTSFAGGVDINTLPQMLVERVEVVTGGASAAYGSDAVVGVVNFILDKRFEGVKTVVQARPSTATPAPTSSGSRRANPCSTAAPMWSSAPSTIPRKA